MREFAYVQKQFEAEPLDPLNGQASTLVTWNVRDFLPAANKFELHIMRPDDFWAEFMQTGFERSK